MGGIRINSAGEVCEQLVGHFGGSRHIRGLYAAGEVTGGVHGGNRLGGNSLLECCVFGRIAGGKSCRKRHKSQTFTCLFYSSHHGVSHQFFLKKAYLCKQKN